MTPQFLVGSITSEMLLENEDVMKGQAVPGWSLVEPVVWFL